MAIAFDAQSNTELTTSATTHTQSHTCTGSDRILFVGVSSIDSPYDVVTGVTYAGVAMTQIDKRFRSGGRGTYLFYLVAPSTGANNIEVTCSSAIRISLDGASFTGADQTSPIGVSATQESASSTITQSLTVGEADSFLVSSMFVNRNQTASTNTTLIGTDINNVMFYSTTAVGTGTQSLVSTQSDATWAVMVYASFKPAAATGYPLWLITA